MVNNDSINSDEHDLVNYVKMSETELKTLKNTYEDRIRYFEKNHWVSRIQKKVKFDIRKSAAKIMLLSMILLFLAIMVIFLIVFLKNSILLEWMPYIVPLLFVFFIPIMFSEIFFNDGTRNLYLELRKIELVMKNMEKPEIRINEKHIFIIRLLADPNYVGGLNREDIRYFSQKHFDKSLDPKTIDKYLEELSYVIDIEEKPYRTKREGRDLNKTKVYILKPLKTSGIP